MINLMKQHPYRTVTIAIIVIGLAVTALLRAETAKGALFFNAVPLYGSKPAPILIQQGVILDGTSTENLTDAASIQDSKIETPVVIHMTGKAELIVQLKAQIAQLQAEVDLLEQN